MKFTRRDQPTLLSAALEPTASIAWKKDAIALGGFDNDGVLAVVGVFQDFSGTEAEMHIAMFNGHLMNRTIMATFAQIAFHERFFALTRLWISISEDNLRAQAAALRVGFAFEFRKRGGFVGGKDGIVFSMTRRQPEQPLPGTPEDTTAIPDGL